MNNKYQEAKDFIKSIANNEYLTDIFDTSLDTLQELIDNMKFVEEVQTLDYLRVQNENEKLEKALDIVCESYEWEDKPPKPYKSWKEWALKESENK